MRRMDIRLRKRNDILQEIAVLNGQEAGKSMELSFVSFLRFRKR